MTSANSDVGVFSVDLLRRSREHIFFLQYLHRLGITVARPSDNSLQRYRDLWLPLVRQHKDLQLLPPPDCAWLWHCHRLAPYRYTKFLKCQFGRTCNPLEANPPFAFQTPAGNVCLGGKEVEAKDETVIMICDQTRNLWNQMYPNDPFFVEEENASSSEEKKVDLLVGGFDLLGSTDRQATFLWQVSGPRFFDDSFLLDAVSQYLKFVKLRKQTEGTRMVIVPTYQIDLMWHTHMLANLAGYYMDCKSIMGSTLNHDDSLNDRTEDGPLDRAFKETQALWKQVYGEEYFAEGGMYRGEPPKEYYSPSWRPDPLDYMNLNPTGLFLHLINLQGASSTNPTGGAYDLKVVWTWKETKSRMSNHSPSEILGDPADCWIKYDDATSKALETEFKGQGGEGGYDLGNGYIVDFLSMKQTKSATGYKRDVQRHVNVVSAFDKPPEKPKVWCWKETRGQMSNHPASSIFSDPADCWIKYDDVATAKLESAYEAKGSIGECSPSKGYKVNFTTMKQTKISTGFQRDVQRVDADSESSYHGTHAATSIFPNSSTSNTANAMWTTVSGTAPDGNPAFITANARSTTPGVNANTLKPFYIFGVKGSYSGYYHITTKEAYEVLAARVRVVAKKKEGEIAVDNCCTLGLCKNSNWMKKLEENLQELKDIEAIAAARAMARAPIGAVGLRPEIQNNPQKRSEHYSDSGEWYFPSKYYAAAGGKIFQ